MHLVIFIPVKICFFWKEIQQSSLIIEIMILKKFKESVNNGGFDYIPCEGLSRQWL